MEQTTMSQATALAALDQLREIPRDVATFVKVARSREDLRILAPNQFATLERSARRQRKTVLRWLSSVFAHSPSDIQITILEEMRMSRRWAQVERLLKTHVNPEIVVRQLSGDEIEIQALREELPTYLRSVGKDKEVASCLELLDDLDEPAQTDEVQMARQVRREITVGWPRLILAIETGIQAITDESISQIPRWDKQFFELNSQ